MVVEYEGGTSLILIQVDGHMGGIGDKGIRKMGADQCHNIGP